MSDNKKKGSLFEKLLGAIGIGVSLYGLKKVIDLYIDSEVDNVISKEEYDSLIQMEKNEFKEKLFYYDKLESKYISEELFKELLLAIEIHNEIPDKIFKVSDIEKLIPFEKTNIKDPDIYKDSLVEILSDYYNREYILFIDEYGLSERIKKEYGQEINYSEKIIRKYSNKRFIINSKYYYKKEE